MLQLGYDLEKNYRNILSILGASPFLFFFFFFLQRIDINIFTPITSNLQKSYFKYSDHAHTVDSLFYAGS